jgi:hypothetical protein
MIVAAIDDAPDPEAGRAVAFPRAATEDQAMAVDATTPRTRRALLAAALGATAGATAAALGHPLPARAANGQPVLIGMSNTATDVTTITNDAFYATALAGVGAGIGIWGRSEGFAGVRGSSTNSMGVWGTSSSSYGVAAESTSYYGVISDSHATDRAAILGRSFGNATGVHGVSGSGGVGFPTASVKAGVFGEATQDSSARGVHGKSTAGRGVYGQATSGQGVRGYATTGTAVYGTSADPMKGYALRAAGRVRFDNCAGIATIAAGTKTKKVTPGVDLVSTSAVVATLQGSAGGTTTVHRCVVDAAANTFTIYLTANATAEVKVGWVVIG